MPDTDATLGPACYGDFDDQHSRTCASSPTECTHSLFLRLLACAPVPPAPCLPFFRATRALGSCLLSGTPVLSAPP
eukprot:2709618-Rhodomonas_salina.2